MTGLSPLTVTLIGPTIGPVVDSVMVSATWSAVGPDFGAIGGTGQLRRIVGALLTYGLLFAVLMLTVCAAGWAISAAHGSWQAASKAKTGLAASVFGAVLIGGALAWANWLLDVGASL